jgi:hypothetical protein
MALNVGGTVWGPRLSEYPPGLDYNSEDGTFTVVDASHAVFTLDDGAVITYEALHPAPPPMICY